LNQIIEVYRQHRGRKRAEAQAEQNAFLIEQGIVSGKLQDATLGTIEDARALGMTQPYSGVFLGFLEGVALFCPWDFHILACGLAGSGKSTTLSMPNCISLAMGETPESIVVFDLKDAELSWATAEGRSTLDGQEAIYINPWGLHGRKNTRINFLSDLIDKAQQGHKIVDDCISKVFMIFGDPEKDGVNAWIKKEAMRFATVLMVYWASSHPERCHPPEFWEFAMMPHEAICQELDAMSTSEDGEGYVSFQANKLLDQYGEKSDQFEWVIEALQNGFALFGKGSVLRDSTLETEFDLRLLKQRPQAVYIIIPDRYVDSHGKYIAMLLDYVISTIAKAKGTVRTTIIADEFSNFPKAQTMLKALRLYRDKLIRIWTFSQDRNGFSEYKDEGGYMPFEENSIGLYWGVTGQHAKDLQDKAGYRSEIITGHSTSAGIGANTGGISGTEQITPILPVSEISQLVQGKAILDAREKLFVIDRLPWWEIDFVKPYIRNKQLDPPPFFEEQ
jgi:type IV secretion system protein VirD4